MKRAHFSYHGKVEDNCHTFHAIQHTVTGFPSLRTKWIGELFREQLIRKTANENVRVMAYTLMPNHYHIASCFADNQARSTFHRSFSRDFCRAVLSEMRSYPDAFWLKDNYGNPYIPPSIFKERVYYTPIYSLNQMFSTLYYIYFNPQKWVDSGRFKSETGGKFFNSSAYDIDHGLQDIVDFDFVCSMLGFDDIKELNQLFAKPKEEVMVIVQQKLSNWKRKDDEKLLKLDPNKPWSCTEGGKSFDRETKMEQNVNKNGLKAKMT